MAQQLCDHGTAVNIFVLKPILYTKYIDSQNNNVMGQDGLICDDVGWWIGFNEGGNSIEDVDIGFCSTVEGMGTNN